MADNRDFTDDCENFDNEIQPIEIAGDTSISAIEEVSVEFQDLSVRYAYHPTSLGNAERFIQRHSKRVQYVVEMAIWIIWMGFWVVDQGEVRVRQWAKDTIKSRYEELNGLDQRHRGFLFGWLQKSESDDKIVEMLKLASTDPNIAVSVSQLDAHPDLLLCGNGVVNLRTGDLAENQQELFLIKRTPILYDPAARSDTWDRFLSEVSLGDGELRHFLQVAAGYSATGMTDEEVMFVVHGPGGCGKSTFIDAISGALGHYHTTANFTTFLARDRSGSGPSEDIARLAGARIVTSIEVDEGQKLAEALVKAITGRDKMAARYLYKATFEFQPQFTLWLICNHLPTVSNIDDAMWRRLLRLPFTYKPTSVNKNLKADLTDPIHASPAILTWIVQGAMDWFKNGLKVPASVRLATEKAREQMDPLADFITEECTIDPAVFTPTTILRMRYELWCRGNGQKYPLGPRNFDRQLEARGLKRDHKYVERKKTWCWVGIREGVTHQKGGEGASDE
jgi:putative DNA primase/helicase